MILGSANRFHWSPIRRSQDDLPATLAYLSHLGLNGASQPNGATSGANGFQSAQMASAPVAQTPGPAAACSASCSIECFAAVRSPTAVPSAPARSGDLVEHRDQNRPRRGSTSYGTAACGWRAYGPGHLTPVRQIGRRRGATSSRPRRAWLWWSIRRRRMA